LPIGEILLVEARQQSRRRVAGAVERSHGAELIGDVLIVLIGDELPLALAQAARQRLLVEAREIAARAGEHAVHLIGDVGVGGGERVGKAGCVTRIQEARLQIRIELRAILLVGAADYRCLRLGVAAGEERVGKIGRLRQELADIVRAAGKPADRGVFLRRERGVRELALQLREDAGEKRLRRRPRIGRPARAGGAALGAGGAAARIDEAVRDLIFVDGLRGSAHDMKLQHSDVVIAGHSASEDALLPAGDDVGPIPSPTARAWRDTPAGA